MLAEGGLHYNIMRVIDNLTGRQITSTATDTLIADT